MIAITSPAVPNEHHPAFKNFGTVTMRLLSAVIIISLAFFSTSKVEAANKLRYLAQASEEAWIDKKSAYTISLNDADFVHRWSSGNTHEFTPPGQEDLSSWHDMITMEYFPDVNDVQDLPRLADKALAIYRQRGAKILGSIATHTLDAPVTNHFIAALLGSTEVVEFVQVRLQILEGIGTVTIYARRFYAPNRANMADWVPKNGPVREKALLQWQATPSYWVMATISSTNSIKAE